MKSIQWSVVVASILSVLIAVLSFRFVALGMSDAFPAMQVHLDTQALAFAVHVVASSIALLLGGFQFLNGFRRKAPGWHRWAGRTYATACIAGGIGGLIIAPQAPGGMVAAAGFGLLAVIWIISTAQAARLAMLRRFDAHREWMMRSFALTFGAVTLRIYLPFFFMADIPYPQASQWVAWLAWVPNLLFAQWLIMRARGDRQAGNAAPLQSGQPGRAGYTARNS